MTDEQFKSIELQLDRLESIAFDTNKAACEAANSLKSIEQHARDSASSLDGIRSTLIWIAIIAAIATLSTCSGK